MKKIIAVLLMLFMIINLSACSKKEVVVDKDAVEKQDNQVKEEQFSLGEVNGYSYQNDFFGFRLDLNSDWYIYSDSELVEVQEVAIDMMDSESATKAFDEGHVVYAFYAQELTTSENIQVIAEGLTLKNLKEEQILSSAIDGVKETLEASGYTVEKLEMMDFTIQGEQHKGLEMIIEINGIKVYQDQILFVKDKYASTVVFTALSLEGLEEQLEFISLVK